jgi:serine/threonine-protein kinase
MAVSLQPGQQFGRYVIKDELGRGGQAVVYRAHQIGPDRDVALKVFDQVEDPKRLDRVRREAIAAGRLRTPHIVTIFDAGDLEGIPYIAMDLIEGASLAQMLVRNQRLPYHRALGVLADVAGAIDATHKSGLIHRDIKPANVLLDTDGAAYLSDFGIALLEELPGLTTRGDFLGTLEYISPEQAAGDPATPASDIYAFGVMAYEILVGRPPFVHPQPNAVLVAHVRDLPPPAHELNPDLPEAVNPILAAALEKAPGDRPASASAIVDELAAALEGVSQPETAGAGPSASPPRQATRIAPGDAATHVAVGARDAPTIADTKVSDPEEVPVPGVRSRARVVIAVAVAAFVLIAASVVVLLAFAHQGSDANATFKKAVAPQIARLNQASLTTGQALVGASNAGDVAHVAEVAKSQLATVTSAEAAIAAIPVGAGAQAARSALMRATGAERQYLTQLAGVRSATSTSVIGGLQARADAVTSSYAAFVALEPEISNAIAGSGIANLTGLKRAIAKQVAAQQAAAAAPTTESIPFVVCPTSGPNNPSSSLPTAISVSVPRNQAGQLAFYGDNVGNDHVLAPAGWTCSAFVGQDGGTTVTVVPNGQALPQGNFAAFSGQSVAISATSCFSCALDAAAPLFPAAASQDENSFPGVTLNTRPPGESVFAISSTIVDFHDPPGVAGDGIGSGGPYGTHGVLIFVEDPIRTQNASCTLPDAQKSLCTTIVNQFISEYGTP